MNKKIIALLFTAAFLVLPLANIHAQVGTIPPVPVGGYLNPAFVVLRIINFVWVVAVGIIIISFIVSGILFLTAQGDPTRLDKARTAAIWGVAGIVVAVLAFSVIWIIGVLLTP